MTHKLSPQGKTRAVVRDNMMTYDGAGMLTCDAKGNQVGRKLGGAYTSYDGKTYDSTGTFFVGELERLDQTMHEPLHDTKWMRDIDLREDVSIADEITSFSLSTFGSQGGLGTGSSIGNGKAWVGKDTTQISGVGVDIAKTPHPLRLWALELKYTIPELESAAKAGRPIDAQKFAALKVKHQMDTDEQVYIGDTALNDTGLVNNSLVTNVANVAATGSGGGTAWTTKSPAEILQDVNELLVNVWTQSAYAVMPDRLLLPPQQFGYISTEVVSTAGSVSILKYLTENSILSTSGNGKLQIYPSKWLVGAAAGGTIGTSDGHDRMVAYTKNKEYVRFPATMLQKTPIQYRGLYHETTYYCRLGVVEVVYPDTIGYRDLL